MKPLWTLMLLALLLTLAAWFSLQGVSRANSLGAADAPPLTVSVSPVKVPPRPASARPAPPEPTLAVKPPSPQQLALQHALESADLCATSRALEGTGSTDAFGALLSVIEPSATLLEVYGASGPMMAQAVPGLDDPKASQLKYKSLAAQVLWAMKAAGLLYAPVSPAGDNAKAAREMLVELAKKDPGNGFYPFFRLAVEEKLGYTPEQLRATADEITSASVFDSRLGDVFGEMRDASWLNPAIHYAMENIHSVNVFPYYQVTRLLQRLETESHFTGNGRIAILLSESGARGDVNDPAFDGSQYGAGHTLDPANVVSLAELRKRSPRKERYGPGMYHEEAGKSVCDPAAYEAFFFEAREGR